jgi:uncharacterized protein (DUF952 family)
MSVLYHIASRTDWEKAHAEGIYTPSSFSSQGFVLCAGAEQYVQLANMLFTGQSELLLLFIGTAVLPAAPRQTEIHGIPVASIDYPLPLSAVFEIAPFSPSLDGAFHPHHETRALTIRADEPLEDIQTRACHVMAGFNRPWWIAGGWAIDCFLGIKTRPHADLEIAILAADQTILFQHLRGWDLRIAAPGAAFKRWDGQPLPVPYHQIWAKQSACQDETPDDFSTDPTMLDILIEDHDKDLWQYRRKNTLSRPISEFGHLRDGTPFVRPEIALLYKAPAPRHKDQRDFDHVLPRLEAHARNWLAAAISALHPNSVWRTLV